MNVKKTFLYSTDALCSSWYEVCVLSCLHITALLNVVCARHRNRYNYIMTAHKMVPECITMKETQNREREIEKTQFLVLPVLIVAFLHDLDSGLGFATVLKHQHTKREYQRINVWVCISTELVRARKLLFI